MEAWTAEEIAAVSGRNKRRIWLFELQLTAATWRAGQSIRDVVDAAGRTWQGVGANGEVNGVGTALGRRPREVTVALHGIRKGESLYSRIIDAGAVGAPALLYMAWVNAAEVLIVQPKLRFAGIIGANPKVTLGATDRVSLLLLPGTRRANRLAPPWDASPASHRAFVGAEDPVYDRVTTHTQFPAAI